MNHRKISRPTTSDTVAVLKVTQHISALLIIMCISFMFSVNPEVTNGATSYSKEIIEGEGFGLPRTNAKDHAERCVSARRAAEIDARRALAESIKSYVESTAQSSNNRVLEENTKIIVNQALNGSKVILVDVSASCDTARVKVQTEIDLQKLVQSNKIDESQINQLTDIMVIGCSLGQKITFEVEASGGLSFMAKGVKGHFKSDRSEIPSVIEFIASKEVRDERKSISDCMRPYMDRIFDAILIKSNP